MTTVSKRAIATVALALVASMPIATRAQEPAAPTPPAAPAPPAATMVSNDGPLVRCTVVLSRYKGEEQISSMPFELLVSSRRNGFGDPTSLRVGVDAAGETFVGTSIDARVQAVSLGVFNVHLGLEDATFTASRPAERAVSPNGVRRYSVRNMLTVREGQTLEFSVGTDPFSGETTRATVTVRLVK